MINTKKSQFYTLKGIESFFKSTPFTQNDRFLLIDNDCSLNHQIEKVEIIKNPQPKGVAANFNQAIRIAKESNQDLFFLNNDMIFPSGWLEPFLKYSDKILIPLCNQQIECSNKKIRFKPYMDWEDYADQQDELNEIAKTHAERFKNHKLVTELVMPFYCFLLPLSIVLKIGEFDESFGKGGGEDTDYRMRCLLAGFDAYFLYESMVLHFMGKSTWRSGESEQETDDRDQFYRKRFMEKWGVQASYVFMGIGTPDPDIQELVQQEKYREALLKSLERKENTK